MIPLVLFSDSSVMTIFATDIIARTAIQRKSASLRRLLANGMTL